MITLFDINRRLRGAQNVGRFDFDHAAQCRVYPLALAALAVSAAGTGAQMVGQNEAQSARDRAQRAEMNRQTGYQRQAQAVADQSIAESGRSTADPAMAQATDQRVANFNRIVSQGQAPLTGNTVNRSIVTSSGSGAPAPALTASAAAWNKILGGAQAKLGGYSDWGLQRNIAAKRAGQKLDTIGSNARGSANVLGAELQDASHAGDGWGMAGSVLGALGSVGGAYAATMPGALTIPAAAGTAGVDYSPQMLQWGMLPA